MITCYHVCMCVPPLPPLLLPPPLHSLVVFITPLCFTSRSSGWGGLKSRTSTFCDGGGGGGPRGAAIIRRGTSAPPMLALPWGGGPLAESYIDGLCPGLLFPGLPTPSLAGEPPLAASCMNGLIEGSRTFDERGDEWGRLALSYRIALGSKC